MRACVRAGGRARLIWQRVVCDWYVHESGPVLPGTDWLSLHSGRGQRLKVCSWLGLSQVSGTAMQERRAEAEGSASEQLREEEEGERRGELRAQDWATAPNTAVFLLLL